MGFYWARAAVGIRCIESHVPWVVYQVAFQDLVVLRKTQKQKAKCFMLQLLHFIFPGSHQLIDVKKAIEIADGYFLGNGVVGNGFHRESTSANQVDAA